MRRRDTDFACLTTSVMNGIQLSDENFAAGTSGNSIPQLTTLQPVPFQPS